MPDTELEPGNEGALASLMQSAKRLQLFFSVQDYALI